MKASRNLIAALVAAMGAIGLGSYAFADKGGTIDPAALPIGQDQAMSIALQSVPGSVVATELESEDGVAVWEIEILDSANRTVELEIDAHTGDVLASEVEDDDNDNDEDESMEQMGPDVQRDN